MHIASTLKCFEENHKIENHGIANISFSRFTFFLPPSLIVACVKVCLDGHFYELYLGRVAQCGHSYEWSVCVCVGKHHVCPWFTVKERPTVSPCVYICQLFHPQNLFTNFHVFADCRELNFSTSYHSSPFWSPIVFYELAQHAFKLQGYVLGSL